MMFGIEAFNTLIIPGDLMREQVGQKLSQSEKRRVALILEGGADGLTLKREASALKIRMAARRYC